ncbi:MAG: YCF48-related protein [Patescibacteria group bacterium]|jgi:photosystem II stability/assembly factor-like uncharacterized protein
MKRILGVFLVASFVAVTLSGCTLAFRKTPPADGGIYRSENSGETWDAKNFVGVQNNRAVTIGGLDLSELVFDPRDPLKAYFVSRGGGVWRTSDGMEHWERTTLAAGTYSGLSIDFQNTDIMYASQGTTLVKTVDGMKTWSTIYIETRPKEALTSVLVDHTDPSHVYLATTTSVLKSDDYGTTWRTLSWTGSKAAKLYMSRLDNRVIYLYALNFGFYKTTDSGETWIDISAPLDAYPKARTINSVDFSPFSERITIATGYGILTTVDSGVTWTPIETLIPFGSVSIRAGIINPVNPNEIIFAVNNVLHKTVDGGQTWKTIKTIPTSRPIASLYFAPYDRSILFSGTQLIAQK